MSKSVEQFKMNYAKRITKLAKKTSKTPDVKLMLANLKQHFKQDRWALNYDLYKDISGIKYADLFNRVLELAGYQIVYRSPTLVIKPKRGGRK